MTRRTKAWSSLLTGTSLKIYSSTVPFYVVQPLPSRYRLSDIVNCLQEEVCEMDSADGHRRVPSSEEEREQALDRVVRRLYRKDAERMADTILGGMDSSYLSRMLYTREMADYQRHSYIERVRCWWRWWSRWGSLELNAEDIRELRNIVRERMVADLVQVKMSGGGEAEGEELLRRFGISSNLLRPSCELLYVAHHYYCINNYSFYFFY